MRVPAFPADNRRILKYDLADEQEFKTGAAVVLNAGKVEECEADPALMLGFALHRAGAEPDYGIILVAVAEDGRTFWVQGLTDPVEADTGASYGLTKDGDGVWVVDKSKTGEDARVVVQDVDTVRNLYRVAVKAEYRQLSA